MKKLLAMLLISCAWPVWAEWVQYSESEEGERHYFDLSTVKGERVKRIWTRMEASTKNPSDWQSARALEEIDCQNDRTRILQAEFFFQPNLKQLKDRVLRPLDWAYVAPGTIQETLFNKVCGKK
jgi:hypothetical protein